MWLQFPSSLLALFAGLGGVLVHASPHDPGPALLRPRQLEFRSEIHNDSCIRYVLNSGVCETTPDVRQISGYLDVGLNMSMWFWFFEARKSPETAPFTLWLNGGPGCSSMIGLFQENGPCRVEADGTSTQINLYSWNNISNMIYLDQPTGTGFSYGTETVNNTESAAPFVWKAFQVLFESQLFSQYRSREFIFATESYGGHYGPSFVSYFEEQNARIARGAKGESIVVSALMINNGWFDAIIQNKAYYTFAENAPGYGQLQNYSVLKDIHSALYDPRGCVAQEKDCYAASSADSDQICSQADNYCRNKVLVPAVENRDPYDLRQNSSPFFPPEYYVNYLGLQEVVDAIGAESVYQECTNDVYVSFNKTGDASRSWLPQLSELANSGLKILIWAGDADIICNWVGVHNVVLAMDWYGAATFRNTSLSNITLNGEPIAAVANVDKFSFARMYDAGHEVPAFQPAAALAIFEQIINKEPLHSV